jgi:hypothetical protein
MNKYLCNFRLARLFVILFAVTFAAACLDAESATQQQQHSVDEWNPKKTKVFIVELLEWQDAENFKPFPQENRRDDELLEVLKNKGVPEEQIYKLKDKTATTSKIQNVFENFLRQSEPDEWLFVYYSGHGYKEDDGHVYLASYDAGVNGALGWSVDSIPDTIEQYFKGNRAIIALDNCNSGAIVDAVKNRQSKISYAALATTPASSSSTGNWTFTESLIHALRGASYIDSDADGKINFGEMIKNSYDDMLFAEEQVAQFELTGDFSDKTVLTGARKSDNPRLGERIEAFDGYDWYRAIITDSKNDLYRVHYYGYYDDQDEYVDAKAIRTVVPKHFKKGDRVEAESFGEWYPAKILDVKGGAHYVSFDGYEASENEWLPSDCIRKRKRKKHK